MWHFGLKHLCSSNVDRNVYVHVTEWLLWLLVAGM